MSMIVMVCLAFRRERFLLFERKERIVFRAGEAPAILFVREKRDEQKSKNQTEKERERNGRHDVEISTDIICVVFQAPAHFLPDLGHSLETVKSSGWRAGVLIALLWPARYRSRGPPVSVLPATDYTRHVGLPVWKDRAGSIEISCSQSSRIDGSGLRSGCDSLCSVCPKNAWFLPGDAAPGASTGVFLLGSACDFRIPVVRRQRPAGYAARRRIVRRPGGTSGRADWPR